MAQTVKNLPAMQETHVWSLSLEDLLEKGIATHSSILAWKIPWTEEPGGLQSMGSQKSQTRLKQLSTHTVEVTPKVLIHCFYPCPPLGTQIHTPTCLPVQTDLSGVSSAHHIVHQNETASTSPEHASLQNSQLFWVTVLRQSKAFP